jgi:hypothetical protein
MTALAVTLVLPFCANSMSREGGAKRGPTGHVGVELEDGGPFLYCLPLLGPEGRQNGCTGQLVRVPLEDAHDGDGYGVQLIAHGPNRFVRQLRTQFAQERSADRDAQASVAVVAGRD